MTTDDSKMILLVEDEFLIAMGTQRELETYGYTVQHVNSGEKAVNISRENSDIDLILMDIDLGKGIDGTEAAALILKDHNIPIVFVSSHTEKEIVEKTEKITSYGYVVKSSSITVLDASIKMAFKLFDAQSKTFENERKLKAALSSMSDAVFISDLEGTFIDFNEAFATFHKFKNKDECSKMLKDYPVFLDVFTLEGEFVPLEMWVVPRALRGETGSNEEYVLKRKDTAETWIGSYNYSPIRNSNGDIIGSVVTACDITESKLDEEDLARTKTLLSETEKTGKIGGWFVDLETMNQTWTEETYRIHEVDMDFEQNVRTGINFYAPSSRPIIEQAFNHTIKTGEPYDLELELITAKGNRIWVHSVGKAQQVDGVTKVVSGSFQDITERKLAEKEIKKQLSEKEIILKETHHRIKNNFSSIESLLSLQVNSSDNPEVKSALGIAMGRVKGFSVLYEKLLLSENYQTTSVKDYLNNLVDDIINLSSNELNLTIEKQFDDIPLDPKLLFPIGLIVNELLTNVMKYAFLNRDSGVINITLNHKGTEITLTIKDNGNGLPEEFDLAKETGFGLMLIRMLSEQFNGSFTIDNHEGTISVIKFPV